MSDVITNMKVRFGADTKNFKKGLDEGKNSSKQFSKDAGSAFDKFAEAFGVNMGKVREGLNSVKQSLTGTTAGLKASAAGSNIFSRALGVLKTALIATGIGALVVALGSLVSYFTKTQRGADFLSKTMAGFKAIISVLTDRFSALGEIIFKAFSNPKQAIADLWEAIKTNIVNRFEGLIELFRAVGNGLESLWKRDMAGLKQAATETGAALVQMTTGLDETQQKKVADSIRGVVTEIKEESRAAMELAKARQELEKREILFIETESRLRAEIDKNRLAEKDYQLSTEERLEANIKANNLVLQLEKQRKELQTERVRIMQQEINLGESMNADLKSLAEEKAKLNQIEGEAARMQRELLEGSKSLQAQFEAETKAILEKRKAETEMLKTLDTIKLKGPEIEIPKLEVDKLLKGLRSDWDQAKSVLIDFSEVFQNSFKDIAVSFGESLGKMLAGAENAQSFGDTIISIFANMAIQAGKIIVAAGLAFFAIGEALQKALTSPATALLAVAAGIALIAVGKYAQTRLNEVGANAGGSIGQNSYVFDSRGSTSALAAIQPESQPRPETITVNVTGEFRQRGSDMVATIAETNKRASYSR
jgi:hypothetical protein